MPPPEKTTAAPRARSTRELVALAQRALGMTHAKFGVALGASQRTSARWAAGQSSLTPRQLGEVARLVHARDAGLAAEIARAAGESLESLGIVGPPPPAPPAAPAKTSPDAKAARRFAVDSVVCAAAEAIDVGPAAVRQALLAALTRARQMGLRAEEVEEVLAEGAKGA
jgi:hypothetical protein